MICKSLKCVFLICAATVVTKCVINSIHLMVTEMNINFMLFCFYLKQQRGIHFNGSHKSLFYYAVMFCLFCCCQLLVLWLTLNAKTANLKNQYDRIRSPKYLLERWMQKNDTNRHQIQKNEDKEVGYRHIFAFASASKQRYWVLPASPGRYLAEAENKRSRSDLMRSEWARYETFKTFPIESPVMPIRLASNGFYYNGSDDSVTCFSCGLVYSGWKEGDSVSNTHARLSRNCHHIKGTDQTNVGIHTDDVQGATGGGEGDFKDGLHVGEVYIERHSRQNDHHKPRQQLQHKYPDYVNISHRMDTFNGWPCHDVIEPQFLVESGFFYVGFSDCVRCFSCGGGLRNWDYGDGPWEEHAKWFPGCSFLREQKGHEFIRHHRETQAHAEDIQETPSTAIVSGQEALNKFEANRGYVKSSLKDTHAKNNTTNDEANAMANPTSSEKHTQNKEILQIFVPMGFSVTDIQTSLEKIEITDSTETALRRILDDLLERSHEHDGEEQSEFPDKTSKPLFDQKIKRTNTDASTAQATLSNSSELDSETIKEENTRLIDHLTCKICMERVSDVVFVPCGHVVSCQTCAPLIRKCAICRQPIKGRVRAVMS